MYTDFDPGRPPPAPKASQRYKIMHRSFFMVFVIIGKENESVLRRLMRMGRAVSMHIYWRDLSYSPPSLIETTEGLL